MSQTKHTNSSSEELVQRLRAKVKATHSSSDSININHLKRPRTAQLNKKREECSMKLGNKDILMMKNDIEKNLLSSFESK
jgi:hypothetical protein